MRKFDTQVQHLKYKVLREVARLAWNDELMEKVLDIPRQIVPVRCAAACIRSVRSSVRGSSLPWAATEAIRML